MCENPITAIRHGPSDFIAHPFAVVLT
jgi:hypothetical protein